MQMDAGAARAKVAKLGLAAVLAYGLLDGVTYTIAFTLAFLGYEKSTGLNPARNLKSLLGVSFASGTDLPLFKVRSKSPSRSEARSRSTFGMLQDRFKELVESRLCRKCSVVAQIKACGLEDHDSGLLRQIF
jgi:hypothetical protein